MVSLVAVIARRAALKWITPSRGVFDTTMDSDESKFSVSEDGKLVVEEDEEANFEENLTFED